MKTKVINTNKRGWAMLTIVHEGRSETRHCRIIDGRYQGYVLDADKNVLREMEALSRQASAALRTGGIASEPYTANLFCLYDEGDTAASYGAHMKAELRRARDIGQRQHDEAAKMHAEQEAKRGKKAA
jgi:hypothetical protein